MTGEATHAKIASVQTAPAEMPGEEEIARVLCEARHQMPVSPDQWAAEMAHIKAMEAKYPTYITGFSTGTDAMRQARAILALFATKEQKPLTLADEAASSEIAVQSQPRIGAKRAETILPPADELGQWKARALAAEAALAAERERAAQIGYRVCAETRHVTLGDKVAAAIRAQGDGNA